MDTMQHTEMLKVHECPSCFVVHAIPRRMEQDRLAGGGSVYCPNGHRWVFSEPETEKLKKDLAAARRRSEAAAAQLTHERDQRLAAERSASAYKGQATRIRNRVGAGVCPCCTRTFANLARHMAGQHPDFREQAPSA